MNARAGWPLWILLAAATTARGETVRTGYSRPIKSPPLAQDELLAVTLDSDVFADTRDGFPNLRVQDTNGRPVGHVLRRPQTSKTQSVTQTWSRSPSSAKPLEGGGLEFTVQLDEKDGQPTGLRLITPLRDFEQRVRVYTSVDATQWEPAGEETLIFDYSRYVDVRNDSIKLPETTHRNCRIVIDDVTVEQESELLLLTRRLRGGDEQGRTEKIVIDRRPFRIERVEFRRVVQQERSAGETKTEYPLGRLQVTSVPEKKQTLVEFDARREPLTSLRLVTPERNFSRRVVLEVPQADGKDDRWQSQAPAVLSRIDFKSLHREELAINFPELRQSRYRLVIDNRDSPPLPIDAIHAEGNVYELVFLASPGRSYRMLYGATVEPATYDTAAVQELLRAGFQPQRGELEAPVPETAMLPTPRSDWWNNRPLLIGVVAALVAALAWGLFRASKRIESLPRE